MNNIHYDETGLNAFQKQYIGIFLNSLLCLELRIMLFNFTCMTTPIFALDSGHEFFFISVVYD